MIKKSYLDINTGSYGYETDIRINGKELSNDICGIRIEISATETPKIALDYGSGYLEAHDGPPFS